MAGAMVFGCCAVPDRLASQPVPPPSEDITDGAGLLRDGARRLFRGLMGSVEPALRDLGERVDDLDPMLRDLAALMGDIARYDAPVILPNGDILIRRRSDPPPIDGPSEPPPQGGLPAPTAKPPGTGEIEL